MAALELLSRRSFLRGAIAVAPALVIPAPVSYFFSPKGGWGHWVPWSDHWQPPSEERLVAAIDIYRSEFGEHRIIAPRYVGRRKWVTEAGGEPTLILASKEQAQVIRGYR